MEIKLTKGLVAIVPDNVFEHLNAWNWHAGKYGRTFYAIRNSPRKNKKRKTILMHRIIWELLHPEYIGTKYQLDHVDGVGFNNLENNLRVASVIENQRNKIKPNNCSSKYKGIHWNKEKGKWQAQIRAGELCQNGKHKQIHLGYFCSEIEAAEAYNQAAIKYFGEFAKLNFTLRNYQ
jgi:hypothetical protein